MKFFTEEKIEKLLSDIKATIHRASIPIASFRFAEGDHKDAHRPDFDDSGWSDFSVMNYWGGYDVVAWFRTKVTVLPDLMDKRLELRFLVGPRDGGNSTAEALLYINGQPLQAIDVWHESAWIPPEYLRTGELSIAIRAWSGVLGVPDRRRFKVAELNQIDEAAEQFYYTAYTLLQVVRELDANDWRKEHVLNGLNHSFQLINFTKIRSNEYYDSIGLALDALKTLLAELRGQELRKPKVTAVGHSHIDMAWLWRLGHTREKAGRTFATVLHLMRQYPEYRFLHSSPQLYEYVEQDYPEIFEQIKARIDAGDWEITGGMWVESDINIPSGESLIRQFLLGKRYIRETFGKETRLLWLPDVFGYSWALPQIIKQSGIDYFMTTKISWSQVNRFPYDTFYWRGIDGSEILTHFVTTPDPDSWFYTYNGQLRPQDVKGIWNTYRQKSVNDELLLTYGWGDGGGGPTREMIEQGRVLQDIPGIPRVEFGMAEPYFKQLQQRVAGENLPVWDGELYLEYHRGTYTSQAAIKRANRRSEILFHNVEWLSALADVLLNEDQYPADALKNGWKLILLNQFHDILPGSSIREVYEDSLRDYEQIQSVGKAALTTAVKSLAENIKSEQESILVLNSLAWHRDDLIELPVEQAGQTLLADDGLPAPSQLSADGTTLVFARNIPSLGYRMLSLVEPNGVQNELTVTRSLMENRFFQIRLNEYGQLASVFDKTHDREVLVEGQPANQLIAFEDKPMRFDAWDIDLYYQDKPYVVNQLVDIGVEEQGPLRGTLKLVWRFYDSTITQRMSIYSDVPRIDFRTHIDWHEQQVLLKAAFPVNVRSTKATYDIQFGNIERPTHWNTSWDYARFEVVGHKWVDLSETNYGVSLLNDCKYGHDVKDNVIRLTLIKSAISPDPNADQGEHVFTYSLLPHGGDWWSAGVDRRAYELNYPLIGHPAQACPAGKLPSSTWFACVDSNNVVIETVKRAEDERAYVIRLYENHGSRLKNVTLELGSELSAAEICNLVEEESRSYPFSGSTLKFDIAPYEIKTFKLRF